MTEMYFTFPSIKGMKSAIFVRVSFVNQCKSPESNISQTSEAKLHQPKSLSSVTFLWSKNSQRSTQTIRSQKTGLSSLLDNS